jgi:hypothetical protein
VDWEDGELSFGFVRTGAAAQAGKSGQHIPGRKHQNKKKMEFPEIFFLSTSSVSKNSDVVQNHWKSIRTTQSTSVVWKPYQVVKYKLLYLKLTSYNFSLNQVRVRDVVADDENTFEVHKLEHLKAESSDDTKGGIVMRIVCESEDFKNEWVKAINSEVKLLRSTAKSISNQFRII